MAPTDTEGRSDIKLQVIEADEVHTDGTKIVELVEAGPRQRLSVLVDPTGWAAAQPDPNVYRMMITVNPYEWRHVQIKAVMIRSYAYIYEKTKVLETGSNTLRLCFLGFDANKNCIGNNSDFPIPWNFNDFDDIDLRPLDGKVVPLPTDPVPRFLIQTSESKPERWANLRIIRYDFQGMLDNTEGYMKFEPQGTPALEIIRQNKGTYKGLAEWKHMTIVPDDKTSFILAMHSLTGTHPIHLMATSSGSYIGNDNTDQKSGAITLNERLRKVFTFNEQDSPLKSFHGEDIQITPNRNPVMRDTITLYKYGLVALQIEADNPRPWILHCHNDFHAHSGMSSMVIAKPNSVQEVLDTLANSDLGDHWMVMNGDAFDRA